MRSLVTALSVAERQRMGQEKVKRSSKGCAMGGGRGQFTCAERHDRASRLGDWGQTELVARRVQELQAGHAGEPAVMVSRGSFPRPDAPLCRGARDGPRGRAAAAKWGRFIKRRRGFR